MERYERYKDSEVEWIGEVPEHWEVKRLKFVGESIIGITYNPSEVSLTGEGFLVLRSSNIQNGVLSFEDNVHVQKNINEKHITKPGDILLCARNGSAHLVGKAAFITNQYEGLSFGAFMTIVRSKLEKFLYYFFNSEIFKAQTGLYSTSTINQLTSDTLDNMSIAFPTLIEEQVAIIKHLDRKTAEIDQLIADKKRLITLYEEEKTALINQAVTKGINPKVKMKDSGIEWLGEVPEHWEVKKIFYVAKINSGGTPDRSNSDYWKGSIPWVKTGEVNYNLIKSTEEHITEDGLKASSAKIAPVGTLLMAMYGQGNTRGRVALLGVPATYNQACCAMIFKEMMDSRFAFFYFKAAYQHIRDDGNETSQMNISTGYISSLRMPVPPIEEQYQIIEHIELGISIVDSKIAKTQKLIDLLSEYRTALISEVVTGKIKVIE